MITIKDVSKILFEVWDPIEIKYVVTATDEYDDWAPPILDVLNTGASEGLVERALQHLLIAQGMRPSFERNKATARALVALRDRA